MSERSLGDLKVGDTASIEAVRCHRPTAVRLMEMGLVRGTRVEVRRVAPLGDPIELFVSGYALSIRKAEAAAIDVSRVTEKVAARAGAALRKAAPATESAPDELAPSSTRLPMSEGT